MSWIVVINLLKLSDFPMGSTVRMNLPLPNWSIVALCILVILMVCVKIFKLWPLEGGIPPKPTSVKDFYLNWADTSNKGVVCYREIFPSGGAKLDVLLLHGMSFSSNNWVEINTLNILASSGYRVIALDLPGYGKSTYKLDTALSRGEFLWQFIKKTGLDSPVIVSPSMSGTFSLSYLADAKPAKGFVAIAIVGTDKIAVKDYAHFPPTLIVRGSRDVNLGVTSTNILHENLPQNSVKVIEDAGHACYLDKPGEFHAMLLGFLQTIMVKSFRE